MKDAPPVPPVNDLGEIDPTSARVVAAMRRTMHLNRQYLMKVAGGKGGHPGQSGCLRMLSNHEGVSQRDLAEMLHLSRPTVTALVQRLETDDLVERWSDADDQRLTRIRLTEEGRARSDALRASFHEYVDKTVGRMSEPDRVELLRLLSVLADYTAEALGSSTEGLPD